MPPSDPRDSHPAREGLLDAAPHPEDDRLDETVEHLAVNIPPVAPDDLCQVAYERFVRERRLHAIPVVNEAGRPVGLVNRFAMLEWFSQRFGHELLSRRCVADVMEPHPLIVECHMTLDDLGSLIVEDDGQYVFEGFIVTRGSVYVGVGTAYSLMRRFSQRRQAVLYHLAHHDPLTGLPNRSMFDQRLAAALAGSERERVALLFIDLDRFKIINDTFGHELGDLLLTAVAGRLTSAVRGTDLVARLGGDEFAVIVSPAASDDVPSVVASKLQDVMARPFMLRDQELHVSCSIGVALYPDDGLGRQALLRAADAAVYHAKQVRNTWQRYSADMDRPMFQTVWTFSALKRAVDGGELDVFYQPQVAVDTGDIVGVEALVRWRHPTEGMLPPSELIALAEETGLIMAIGEDVLRAAVRQLRRWDEALGHERLTLAVNVSGVQIREGGLVTLLERLLRETPIAPGRLELEITESAAMGSAASPQSTLRQIKAMGVRLAVDDFGTGYSSLSRLERLPVDTLKIDRTFLTNVGAANGGALAKAVILIGRSLKLRVAAEGVEREDQLAFLRAHGCELAQGYLFSPPLSAEDATAYLRRQI